MFISTKELWLASLGLAWMTKVDIPDLWTQQCSTMGGKANALFVGHVYNERLFCGPSETVACSEIAIISSSLGTFLI